MSGFGKCRNAVSRSDASGPEITVDHEVAKRLVWLSKQEDERIAPAERKRLRESEEMAGLRAAFRAANRHWKPGVNGAKGEWIGGANMPALAPRYVSQTEPNPGDMDRTICGGKIVTLGDAEDSVGYAIEHASAVVEAEEIAKAAEEIFDERTGEVIAEDVYLKLRARNDELLRQSHETAQKLQSVGVDGYTSGEFSTYLFDPVKFTVNPDLLHGSNAVEQAKFRRCNFIPVIAQQKRRFIVKLLEYWLERNPHARFWTFTSGERCTVEDLKERIRELNRKISRLNAEQFMKEAGAEIVFRATETGSLTDEEGREVKNAQGQWLYHPHSHCLVQLKNGKLTRRRWTALLGKVWDFMGANWDEGGQIETVRECAKYPMKPADVCRLNADETKQLFTALHRVHLVQPLGAIKALKESILAAGQTLVYKRIKDANGNDLGPKLVRVKNWNSHMKQPPAEDDVKPFRAKAEAFDGEEIDPGECLEKVICGDGAEGAEKTDRDSGPKVIATLAPGPYFDRVMRAGVLVIAKKFGPVEMREVCGMPGVRNLIGASMESYLAAVELQKAEVAGSDAQRPIRVHTYPVSVRTLPAQNAEQRELSGVLAEPSPPPKLEPFAISA